MGLALKFMLKFDIIILGGTMDKMVQLLLNLMSILTLGFLCSFLYILRKNKKVIWDEIYRRLWL